MLGIVMNGSSSGGGNSSRIAQPPYPQGKYVSLFFSLLTKPPQTMMLQLVNRLDYYLVGADELKILI